MWGEKNRLCHLIENESLRVDFELRHNQMHTDAGNITNAAKPGAVLVI